MKKTISVKNLAFCALCIALCVVLPMAFHAIANAGPIFLPMHIPVLLCGLACGWPYGLVCGLLGPVLSGVLTGMPSPAVLPGMMVECGVYGLVSGLMMQLVHTKKLYADLYISQITAMLLGRILSGVSVLDVACGTGVLIPDYLKRSAAQITAIDIAPEMARIARKKFPQENVTVLCGDAARTRFEPPFDCIMIYNAFPHFPEPERLIAHLAGLLTPGGTLTVAHGFSRRALDAHHAKTAHSVSNGLLPVETLAELFAKHLTVTVQISDDDMYQVVGRH